MSLHKSYSFPKISAPGSQPILTAPQTTGGATQALRESASNLTSLIPGAGIQPSQLTQPFPAILPTSTVPIIPQFPTATPPLPTVAPLSALPIADFRASAQAATTGLASLDKISAQLQTTGVFSSSPSQKIAEGAGSIVGKFGSITFEKMTANAPSFLKLDSLAKAAAALGTSLAIPASGGGIVNSITGALGTAAQAGKSFVANNLASLKGLGSTLGASASAAVSGLVDKGKNLVNNLKAGLAAAGFKGFAPAGEANKDLVSAAGTAEQPGTTAVDLNEELKRSGQGDRGNRSHLVRLTSRVNPAHVIEFMVLPEIVENRTVSYDAVAPAQFGGAFQKYKGTESVQWTVNATFIARNTAEATQNLQYINWLRGWTMPFYGNKILSSGTPGYPSRLGAPPPVLIFEGLRRAMIGPVPVVITSLQWNWPRDVDYIPAISPDGTEDRVPFPTVIQVAIQLIESFSTDQFNNFDLDQYFLGNTREAFGIANIQAALTAPNAGVVPSTEEAGSISRTGSAAAAAAAGSLPAAAPIKAIAERTTAAAQKAPNFAPAAAARGSTPNNPSPPPSGGD